MHNRISGTCTSVEKVTTGGPSREGAGLLLLRAQPRTSSCSSIVSASTSSPTIARARAICAPFGEVFVLGVVVHGRRGSGRRLSGLRRMWTVTDGRPRSKPDPLVISWRGRQLRIRHDDPALKPYSPMAARLRSAVELASDVEGLWLVAATTLGDHDRRMVWVAPSVGLPL